MQKSPSNQRNWIMLFASIAIALSGCKEANLSQQPKIDPIKPSVSPTPLLFPAEPALPSAVWNGEKATFMDPGLGLMVDVPSEWSIHPRTRPLQGTRSSPNVFFSPCIPKGPSVEAPCTKIDIVPGPSLVHSLDELRSKAVTKDDIVLAERRLEINGLPALWIETEYGETGTAHEPKSRVIWVFILINDASIKLTAYGELMPVEVIVNSIRPITDAPVKSP